MTYSPDELRRRPDIEGPGLGASDAADRLILDESAAARAGAGDGEIVVIGDSYGALTLGAADAGGRGIRVHQDPLTGERALALNAEKSGLETTFTSLALAPGLVDGARVVLMRLPRSIDALRDIAGLVAAHAAPDVVVYAGGRIKHMALAMNEVLREHFHTLDITHARQKSRVLVARGPHSGRDPEPRRAVHDGIAVAAFGGVFAGAGLDIGTRFLLEHLPSPSGEVIDFACGNGVVGATLAVRHPGLQVLSCDQSAAAVVSARATALANDIADRMTVIRDDLLSSSADASADLIVLNPPFHSGAAVTEDLAPRFFQDAARVLRPGGELWTVWNSSLGYRPALERIVGPTRQIARNAKFTVTSSAKR